MIDGQYRVEMKIGVIGAGRMGSALIRGFMKSGMVSPGDMIASDKDEEKLRALDVKTTTSNALVARSSDVVLLSVKPRQMEEVLKEIGADAKNKLVVSIAAGITTLFIENVLENARVVRVMPNTPALVQEMASAYCLGKYATEDDVEVVEKLLGSMGATFKVEEELMDAVTGLSGSGPAYFYHIIRAMTEAGIEEGLEEEVALKLAAQTAKGAAEMVLKTGKSPQELIDMVCSPGGTTFEGLNVLKERKVADALKGAVKAATKRSNELAK